MPDVVWEYWRPQAVMNDVQRKSVRGLQRVGTHMVRQIKASLGMGGTGAPSAPGSPPHSQTRRLARSIEYRIWIDASGPRVRIGSWTCVYALIQEVGGTIRPKYAKALAIPISDQAKRWNRGWNAVDNFPGLVFIKSPMGRRIGFLVKRSTRKGVSTSTVHYMLVTEVNLPARPYLRPALWQNIPVIGAMLAGHSLGSITGVTGMPMMGP